MLEPYYQVHVSPIGQKETRMTPSSKKSPFIQTIGTHLDAIQIRAFLIYWIFWHQCLFNYPEQFLFFSFHSQNLLHDAPGSPVVSNWAPKKKILFAYVQSDAISITVMRWRIRFSKSKSLRKRKRGNIRISYTNRGSKIATRRVYTALCRSKWSENCLQRIPNIFLEAKERLEITKIE